MTIHSNINPHDDIAWGPDGLGRAADAPVVPGGEPCPFEGGPTSERISAFPNPDVAQIERFFAAMFKHAEGGWLLFRAFEHKQRSGEEKPLWGAGASIHTSDPQFFDVVNDRARQAATWHRPAVFCPPVVTFQTGANAKGGNILNGLALSAECDQWPSTAKEKLEGLLRKATIVTESGGEWTNPETGEVEPKVHLHWRLKEPTRTEEDHNKLREARALMLRLTGADASNIALVQAS